MEPSPPQHELKKRLRLELLQKRNALELPDRMRRGEQIADHLLATPQVQSARHILLYMTFRSEVPTEPLIVALAHAGKCIAVPHMATGIRALIAAEYAPGDPLEPGPYGVPQPSVLTPIPSHCL